MRALVWAGINELAVTDVPEPRIRNSDDMIVRVTRSATCGSDLPLIGGHLPFLRKGDVLGHEFTGEVVAVGDQVRRHRVGDRVVVCSFIACGRCWYCQQGLYSCCDNGNPNPAMGEERWGFAPGGCFGSSPALGGFAGSHAEYVRVPYADIGAFTIPDDVSDDRAVFAADAAPTGWMGAELGDVRPGDVVAVWGAGAVGHLTVWAAMSRGAEQVILIDRHEYRLDMARRHLGCETLNLEVVDVGEELLDRTGGRGPDVCIEAVGVQASPAGRAPGGSGVAEQVRQKLRRPTERIDALREAIHQCRKGGTVVVLGVFAALADAFPVGAVMNKGLTVRSAQQHGQRYIPMLLDRMSRGELVTEYLATHTMPLEEAPAGYEIFRGKRDDCLRCVFTPW
jgi:Threonine dehydrogenase and related Zn-dependent dehydrogenases